ncbi:hypothetical protein [Frateuria aurantia]|uniref:hypothetical protein n=1 Tax=Frateuria aurantia TaxID=81475 RepID=UPI0012E9B856|nr:hypothetical protein [Frateuria aurantia]
MYTMEIAGINILRRNMNVSVRKMWRRYQWIAEQIPRTVSAPMPAIARKVRADAIAQVADQVVPLREVAEVESHRLVQHIIPAASPHEARYLPLSAGQAARLARAGIMPLNPSR